MEVDVFDCIILGGGPCGMAAGIYAARGALRTAIIDISMFGGALSNYLEIENYPGFAHAEGWELAEKLEEHLNKFEGVKKFPMQEIVEIDFESDPKVIKTHAQEFWTKTIIIATGSSFSKLGVPGEKEYVGKGVSYCAVCDGAFYRDKTVAVVGGGNTAVEEGCYLTRFAKKVYIIHRRNELRADKIVQKKAFENEKVEFIWDSVVEEIKANGTVNAVAVKNVKTGKIKDLPIDGIFPFIGFSPNVDKINGKVAQDEAGFIITDENMQTNIKGVFAAGDVRVTPLRQVITAASDGAVAANAAVKYIESLD